MLITRRSLVLGATAAALSSRLIADEVLAPLAIRIATNQGVENATLQRLMSDRGFAQRLALDITLVESRDIAGPVAALEQGAADLCMISAYAGVLPAIAQGQPIRLIGTAMQKPALVVCSANPALRGIGDLAGRSIGIGEKQGLLHLLMLALLRDHHMPPDAVRFVTVGSNAQVFHAVLSGAVDAGPCGVAGLSDPRTHVLEGGELWRALPDFPYQPAYASLDALAHRRKAVARCLAAYTLLFRFLSQPQSREAYLAARQAVGGDRAEGEQAWDFIHRIQPYARDPGFAPDHLAYLQRLNLFAGLQQQVMPLAAIADPGPALIARRLLGQVAS